jgi:hypothetical protein
MNAFLFSLLQAVRAFQTALEKEPGNTELTTKIGKVSPRLNGSR